MYPFAWQLVIQERGRLLYDVYGEVHGDVEYSQSELHRTNTETGGCGWDGKRRGVWDVNEKAGD